MHSNVKILFSYPSTSIIKYKYYRAAVLFHSNPDGQFDSSVLYGILLNVRDHPKTYIFDIPDPKKANKTFKEYIESLIADGLLPKD